MSAYELCRANLPVTDAQAAQFATYCEMLIDWNGRMNLTAITDPEEIVKKHFADSLLPIALIPKSARVIDVGTGAGFPGLPIKILRPDIELTLLDSLNKRLTFLEAVCAELGIQAARVHMRAEDGGRDKALRESFDVATSRAVANMSALIEYTVPFLKVGGVSLMYKGPQAEAELTDAANALKALRCEAKCVRYEAEWGERNVVIAKKLGVTAAAYPRKAGTAAKKPL